MSGLSAGDDVDSWCTKCKMDLGHRIVAMVGATPKRVICLTCDSQHNYRAPKSADAKAPKATKRRTKASTGKTARQTKLEGRWEDLVGDRPTATFKRYNIKTKFQVEDFIDHPKFGPGAVVAVTAPTKITVVFRDGEKTLAHGMGD